MRRKIGCLPVLDSGELVGIVTEGDFVALAARGVVVPSYATSPAAQRDG
jgi:CBS domain-containing protein